jgi:hypothetical protein
LAFLEVLGDFVWIGQTAIHIGQSRRKQACPKQIEFHGRKDAQIPKTQPKGLQLQAAKGDGAHACGYSAS